jgi:hypothetical protein
VAILKMSLIMKRDEYKNSNTFSENVKVESEMENDNTEPDLASLKEDNDYYDEDFGEAVVKETQIRHEVIEEVEPPVTKTKTKVKKPLSEAKQKQLEKARKKSRESYQRKKLQKQNELIEKEVQRRLKEMQSQTQTRPEPVNVEVKPKPQIKPEVKPEPVKSLIVERYPQEQTHTLPPVLDKRSQLDQEAQALATLFGW